MGLLWCTKLGRETGVASHFAKETDEDHNRPLNLRRKGYLKPQSPRYLLLS